MKKLKCSDCKGELIEVADKNGNVLYKCKKCKEIFDKRKSK